ncbi:VCBS repeat-containing protein [Candidatus Sumerlaeota bacterium]|nr:VCBS repeat-containing protein [Candidatus Sumerlaeota bacterium]
MYFYDFADINGDNQKDLIASNRSGKELFIYWQKDGTFTEKNRLTIRLSPDTLGVDFVDIVPSGGKEIVLIESDRISYISFREGMLSDYDYEEKTLMRLPVLRKPKGVELVLDFLKKYELAQDMNGDGREDLIVPSTEGLSVIYNIDPGRFILRTLPCHSIQKGRVSLRYRSFRLSERPILNELNWRFPWFGNGKKRLSAIGDSIFNLDYYTHTFSQSYFIFDKNKDGRMDVVCSSTLFLQLPDGSFKEQGKEKVEEEFDLKLSILKKIGMPVNFWRTQTRVVDINGDNQREFIVSRETVSVFTPKTEIWIYRWEEVRDQKKPKPRWHFVLKGLPPEYGVLTGSYSLPLIDLDGDGDLDLLLMRLNFQGASVRSHLKSFIRKGIEGKLQTFLWEKGKGYKRPAFSVPIRIDYNAYLSYGDTLIKIIYDKDFDGDGKPDLCITEGRNKIKIFRFLSAKKGYDTTPVGYLMTRYPIIFVNTALLNNDRKQDLVVKTHNPEQDKNFLSIFISKD